MHKKSIESSSSIATVFPGIDITIRLDTQREKKNPMPAMEKEKKTSEKKIPRNKVHTNVFGNNSLIKLLTDCGNEMRST